MADTVSNPNPKQPSSTFKKVVEYASVAVILSMVIGNMFVALRYKSYMKAKIPSWEDAKRSTTSSSSSYNKTNDTKNHQSSSKYSNENSNSNTAHESSHFKRKAHTSSNESRTRSSSNLVMSTNLIRSLSVLGLPYYPVPTTTTVKKAYYQLARKYHPDLFPMDHPERKVYEQKFKNISNAYKECLEKLPFTDHHHHHHESEAHM
jgi:hypothetical protein